jgi:site-specific recombinase XerD
LPGPWVYVLLYLYFYACVWRWLQVICPALAPDRRSVALLAVVAVSVWLDDHQHLADVDLQLLGVVTFPALWRDYRFWLVVESEHEPSTVSEYRRHCYGFAEFLALQTRPKLWHQAKDRDLYRRLEVPVKTGPRAGLPLAPQSRAKIITAVCGLYRFAFEAGYLRRNPMALVRPPKIREGAPRSLDPNELSKLLWNAEDDDRMYLLIWLGYGATLRCAEIASARVEDFYPDPRPGRLRVVGKGRKERWVPLGVEVRAALDRHLAARAAQPGEPLVDNRRFPGRPLQPRSVSRLLGDFIHGILPRGSAHWLRHTGATRALEAAEGTNLEEVRELLGHATDKTTRAYVRAYQWNVRARAVDRIDDPRQPREVTP